MKLSAGSLGGRQIATDVRCRAGSRSNRRRWGPICATDPRWRDSDLRAGELLIAATQQIVADWRAQLRPDIDRALHFGCSRRLAFWAAFGCHIRTAERAEIDQNATRASAPVGPAKPRAIRSACGECAAHWPARNPVRRYDISCAALGGKAPASIRATPVVVVGNTRQQLVKHD